MKRHFSNRGEALSEVTAARLLASRKASLKTVVHDSSGSWDRFSILVLAASGGNEFS